MATTRIGFQERRHGRPLAWLAAVLLALVGGIARAAPSEVGEYEIKAAFLLNFLRYVGWPSSAFPAPTSPLVVGVAGKDPFDGALERTLDGKVVGGRSIVVRRVGTVEECEKCHLVFVPAGEEKNAARLREATAGKPVLFVGESSGFARAFGGLGFYLADRKVRFEIALDRVRSRGLDVSSQLLKLGRVLRDESGPETGSPQ